MQLFRRPRESLDQARADMMMIAHKRLGRVHGEVSVPPEYDLDVARYRTLREVVYDDYLAVFLVHEFVDPSIEIIRQMLCYTRPIIRAEFQYLRRSSHGDFFQLMHLELQLPSLHGFLIPYPNVKVKRVHPNGLLGKYVPLPT